ncbi:unnamed protein product [Darwinula stevensoni]|uniref:Uncharacterized protein n=1 Tax=Darwinula stevensoni TaxID=69355 RepID=A0A7R9A0S5_9CRUS|nr:unnamed protein product [Darwinula stevensoni]CAG0885169.1 unnamed protein product [Darwinula stevensoni]
MSPTYPQNSSRRGEARRSEARRGEARRMPPSVVENAFDIENGREHPLAAETRAVEVLPVIPDVVQLLSAAETSMNRVTSLCLLSLLVLLLADEARCRLERRKICCIDRRRCNIRCLVGRRRRDARPVAGAFQDVGKISFDEAWRLKLKPR